MSLRYQPKRPRLLISDAGLSSVNYKPTIRHQPTIEDLPVETLLKVFSFLPKLQLGSTVALVCRRWNEVQKDPSLYRSLTVGPSMSTVAAIELLKKSPWLQSLEIYDRDNTDDILQHVNKQHIRLERLVVKNCRGSIHEVNLSSNLSNVIAMCSKLRTLSLSGTKCNSPEVYVEVMLKLKSLKAIDFGNTTNFDDLSMKHIVANCNELEELSASPVGVFLEDSHASFVALCAKFHPTLRVLQINAILATDAHLSALEKCVHLETFRVFYAREITDGGLMCFSRLPNLVNLTVTHSLCITAEGWIKFFQQPSTKKIETLTLNGCCYVTEQVRYVILKNLTNLKSFTLNWRGVVIVKWTPIVFE